MKATIEFYLPEDKWEYDLFNHVHDMLSALHDLQDMVRSINKGWINPTNEEIVGQLQDILCESKIYEIE